MANLTFTQEYLLCALNPKGTIPTLKSTEITTCLVAGGLLELLHTDTISINEKKKIIIEKELEQSQYHLQPLYNNLKNNKSIKIQDIAVKYVFSFSKLMDEFVNALIFPMSEKKFVSRETGGLFHSKTVYVPKQDQVLKVVEKIRAEFLESGPVNDETIVLGALLQKSHLIRNYFSKYEADTLKKRLDEIEKSEAGSFIKKIMDYVDTLIAVIASVGGSAGC